MTTTYTLTDGSATESHDSLADARSAAEDWYGYMIDQDDDISEAQREAIHSADFDDCDDVDALNAAIGEWEQRIAEACGKKDFHGHGNYSVRAADAMGLSLVCRVEHHCDSGKATGERCQWTGDTSELTEVEYMPKQHRASHEAAGGCGIYPANGAIRIHVCQDCLESLVDDDWCTEV